MKGGKIRWSLQKNNWNKSLMKRQERS
jgi:hypothetical protein